MLRRIKLGILLSLVVVVSRCRWHWAFVAFVSKSLHAICAINPWLLWVRLTQIHGAKDSVAALCLLYASFIPKFMTSSDKLPHFWKWKTLATASRVFLNARLLEEYLHEWNKTRERRLVDRPIHTSCNALFQHHWIQWPCLRKSVKHPSWTFNGSGTNWLLIALTSTCEKLFGWKTHRSNLW